MKKKIAMIGAGSPGFSRAVGEELMVSEVLKESVFVMMDIDATRVEASANVMRGLVANIKSPLRIEHTTDQRAALAGADYVVTSCEPNRVPFWLKDIAIPEQFGVYQVTGENGGPGGQVHAMRNITIFMQICQDMRELCPDAWLMNFTNPMSFLCTYLNRFGGVKNLGFCHQVHGSFGVIAEMLGMQPGDLQVVSAGINHMNWLTDIRRRNSNASMLDEFLALVQESDYWKNVQPNIPPQKFTRDILDVFGAYPIGYDDHIVEYFPFFYEPHEWEALGFHSNTRLLKEWLQSVAEADADDAFSAQVKAASEINVPFPVDPACSYYKENTCMMMEALETNTPTYTDAIVIPNNGAVPNLPDNAILDIPAVAVGGQVRSVHVGELPTACAEICRRQITIHELVAQATVEGNRQKWLQALCLDPYIHSITQARKIQEAFLAEYADYLPQFS